MEKNKNERGNIMEMCYDGALVMPSSYAVMDEDEMMYLEGGVTVTTVCAVITAAIAGARATYALGQAVGKKLYYKGIDTRSELTWASAIAMSSALVCGLALATLFTLGMQNQIYDMM